MTHKTLMSQNFFYYNKCFQLRDISQYKDYQEPTIAISIETYLWYITCLSYSQITGTGNFFSRMPM